MIMPCDQMTGASAGAKLNCPVEDCLETYKTQCWLERHLKELLPVFEKEKDEKRKGWVMGSLEDRTLEDDEKDFEDKKRDMSIPTQVGAKSCQCRRV